MREYPGDCAEYDQIPPSITPSLPLPEKYAIVLKTMESNTGMSYPSKFLTWPQIICALGLDSAETCTQDLGMLDAEDPVIVMLYLRLSGLRQKYRPFFYWSGNLVYIFLGPRRRTLLPQG